MARPGYFRCRSRGGLSWQPRHGRHDEDAPGRFGHAVCPQPSRARAGSSTAARTPGQRWKPPPSPTVGSVRRASGWSPRQRALSRASCGCNHASAKRNGCPGTSPALCVAAVHPRLPTAYGRDVTHLVAATCRGTCNATPGRAAMVHTRRRTGLRKGAKTRPAVVKPASAASVFVVACRLLHREPAQGGGRRRHARAPVGSAGRHRRHGSGMRGE